jgi:hypothetical protein
MLQQGPFRSLITPVIALLSGLNLIPAPTPLAQNANRDKAPVSQGRDQNRSSSEPVNKIPAFKATGVENAADLKKKPPPLGPGTIAKLIGTEPGSLYVRLTPSQTKVENRGDLRFFKADFVDGGKDYAEWMTAPQYIGQSQLILSLKSYTGHKYLVDCTVAGQSVSFTVEGSGGKQTFALPQTNGHLIFTLEATTAGWHYFQISANGQWIFYSCEVTNL